MHDWGIRLNQGRWQTRERNAKQSQMVVKGQGSRYPPSCWEPGHFLFLGRLTERGRQGSCNNHVVGRASSGMRSRSPYMSGHHGMSNRKQACYQWVQSLSPTYCWPSWQCPAGAQLSDLLCELVKVGTITWPSMSQHPVRPVWASSLPWQMWPSW